MISAGLKAKIDRVLAQKRARAASELTGAFLDELLETTPVESGHAHECWIAAAHEVWSDLQEDTGAIGRAITRHSGDASGDPEATRRGTGSVRTTKHKTTVRLKARLRFINVLEYGGTLTPIAPGGRKVDRNQRFPGPLLGRRSNKGVGVLMWMDESGQMHTALSRTFSAGHYAGNALKAAERRLKR